MYSIQRVIGNCSAVQRLGLHTPIAVNPGRVPGRGTKIPQAPWHSQNKKEFLMTRRKMYAVILHGEAGYRSAHASRFPQHKTTHAEKEGDNLQRGQRSPPGCVMMAEFYSLTLTFLYFPGFQQQACIL